MCVNDPTSGELSRAHPASLALPPSIIHSLRLLTPPAQKKGKGGGGVGVVERWRGWGRSPNLRPPPFTNEPDSRGLTPVTLRASHLPNTNKQEKAHTPPTTSRTRLHEHTCKLMRACVQMKRMQNPGRLAEVKTSAKGTFHSGMMQPDWPKYDPVQPQRTGWSGSFCSSFLPVICKQTKTPLGVSLSLGPIAQRI